MTNPFRGELEIKLNRQVYKTRMTVNSCIQAEQKVGCSLIKLTGELSEGNLTLSQMLHILHPALRGGGNNMTADEVGELIYQAGVGQSMVAVGEVLANVLTGNSEEDEEEKKEDDPALI
tara:strand:- start:215 stop:571 length:357 start_codon:yes stop_codon:yes gene_type:complete